ncbi:hypothetical protein [Winogradskyella marincola]|uniref:Uncharacterized protein n=1 Tax=Winogradskyella marincola TaxID=3037795 RepID=A0ABT6G5K2_9FLAO|nr:hypothetical protein [Winogradskyella sp. YYF002]MDG4717323.1 hypothetical protein [Winogradskyella sp. YYF002]
MLNLEQENIVIENLPKLLEEKTNQKPKDILKELGFCKEHTEIIMELITSANARFHFYKAGMKPKQFSGDFENDRIFNATLKVLIGPKPNLKNRVLKVLKLK